MAGDGGPLRVGTRGSALALWQTNFVIERLHGLYRELAVERVVIRTTGDRIVDRPLGAIGDKGLFTRELEEALRAAQIDLAVHSLKDLPTTMPAGLTLGAVLERDDPRDALLCPGGHTLATLPAGARLGTSSPRRRAQLLALRADLEIVDLRGNVPTRIAKLADGSLDAAVMAHAGLLRLGLLDHVTEVLAPERMLPAVGQGALAVEGRADDARLATLVAPLDHLPTRLATSAERAVLAELEGGCQIPLGALGRISDGTLSLAALVADLDGRTVLRQAATERVADEASAQRLGRLLAARLRASGADALLGRLRAAPPPTPTTIG